MRPVFRQTYVNWECVFACSNVCMCMCVFVMMFVCLTLKFEEKKIILTHGYHSFQFTTNVLPTLLGKIASIRYICFDVGFFGAHTSKSHTISHDLSIRIKVMRPLRFHVFTV